MTLHTDAPHPHVHVVLKAMGEQGERLNIRKATLREWRSQFAENLREVGVAANATERAVRGSTRVNKRDGLFRAAQRGRSNYPEPAQRESARNSHFNSARANLSEPRPSQTRAAVIDGWRQVAANLRASGDHELADKIRMFVGTMPPALTLRESPTKAERQRDREGPEVGR